MPRLVKMAHCNKSIVKLALLLMSNLLFLKSCAGIN